MGGPKPAGPLGTTEPGAFDLYGRAIHEFDKVLGPAQKLAPYLPLPVQKAVTIAGAEHKKRGKNLLEIPPPDDAPVVATFTIGPPLAPDFNFDHGFLDLIVGGRHVLDDSKRQPPTKKDHDRYRLWEDAAFGGLLIRPDLADAVLAYLHFLHGNGAPYHFAYERFVTSDDCGRRVLESALADARQGALALARTLAMVDDPHWLRSFQMLSGVVTVSDGDRYPYPSTESWQKTIGGHALWISANVDMALDPPRNVMTLTVATTLHAADMYNFNPENHDITSGIPDAQNGPFEVTGLGHEFVQTGEVARTFAFDAPLPPPARGGRGLGPR
jgi:hypothetical protein